MNAPTRLYGLPHAEHLHASPAAVWERDIEPTVDGPGRATIVEWTVHDPAHHLPDVDRVIDHIYDWSGDMGEVSEDWPAHFPLGDDDVRAAAATLLDVIASKITYRMADQRVTDHVLEWDATGQRPLLNGEPLPTTTPHP